MSKYVIIDAEAVQKRIEELRQVCNEEVGYASHEIYFALDNLLSQSSPLIPEIEKAYEAGKLDKELSLSFDNPKSRFITNLKFDI